MLLATFSISLILGFGKRWNELEAMGENAYNHRTNLAEIDKNFLNVMIIISTAITAISYALYTMDPEVISKYGTDSLIYTVPFVLYGLFRYLLLIYCKGKGGSPEEMVISDPGIIITVLLWGCMILFQIYFKNFIKDIFKIGFELPALLNTIVG
jgi:decaprenyl-phosphate phosphoribosyltransferase